MEQTEIDMLWKEVKQSFLECHLIAEAHSEKDITVEKIKER